jgi:hypothetical protein
MCLLLSGAAMCCDLERPSWTGAALKSLCWERRTQCLVKAAGWWRKLQRWRGETDGYARNDTVSIMSKLSGWSNMLWLKSCLCEGGTWSLLISQIYLASVPHAQERLSLTLTTLKRAIRHAEHYMSYQGLCFFFKWQLFCSMHWPVWLVSWCLILFWLRIQAGLLYCTPCRHIVWTCTVLITIHSGRTIRSQIFKKKHCSLPPTCDSSLGPCSLW